MNPYNDYSNFNNNQHFNYSISPNNNLIVNSNQKLVKIVTTIIIVVILFLGICAYLLKPVSVHNTNKNLNRYKQEMSQYVNFDRQTCQIEDTVDSNGYNDFINKSYYDKKTNTYVIQLSPKMMNSLNAEQKIALKSKHFLQSKNKKEKAMGHNGLQYLRRGQKFNQNIDMVRILTMMTIVESKKSAKDNHVHIDKVLVRPCNNLLKYMALSGNVYSNIKNNAGIMSKRMPKPSKLGKQINKAEKQRQKDNAQRKEAGVTRTTINGI